MFYCDSCATDLAWPRSLWHSYGRCEMCHKVAGCNDVTSRQLPEPSEAQFALIAARLNPVVIQEYP